MDRGRIPFEEEDQRRIASSATWGTVVAVTSIASGGIGAILAFSKGDSTESIVTVVFLMGSAVLNVWLLQASLAFRAVASADSASQAQLLRGFRRLRAYFLAQAMFFVVVMALVVLGLSAICVAK